MAARNRSRSPHGAGGEDAISLIFAREQARLEKNFTLADQLREQITALGVTLYDKTNTWRSSDGQSGRIPTFTELENGVSPAALANSPPAIANGGGEDGQIKWLVQSREQARARKDFEASDQIREELRGLGVEVFDKEKIWKGPNGSCGVVVGYSTRGGPTDMEISTLVVQREKARQGSDFPMADMIRDELKAQGVEIYDKDKVWRASDGRSGPVPTWQAIAGGVDASAGAGAAVVANIAQVLPQMRQQAGGNLAAENAMLRQLLGQVAGLQRPAAGAKGGKGGGAAMPRPATQPHGSELAEAIKYCEQAGKAGGWAADADIAWLVQLREKIRQAKDYLGGDKLRAALKNHLGVELMEKEKRWVSADGRQGAIPMWDKL